MESKTSKTKGDNKTYEGNLGDPIYSLDSSNSASVRSRTGPDRRVDRRGRRGAASDVCYVQRQAFEL
jgi:hypothetical protein